MRLMQGSMCTILYGGKKIVRIEGETHLMIVRVVKKRMIMQNQIMALRSSLKNTLKMEKDQMRSYLIRLPWIKKQGLMMVN